MSATLPAQSAATAQSPTLAAKTIAIIGMGNIGGFLISLLARMTMIKHLLVVDGDRYDESNLSGQNIQADAVGQPKAAVQADYARSLGREDLIVEGIHRWVDLVPLGVLAQADLIIGCVDSKAARQTISEIAFRLDSPYLDTGINTGQPMTRISFFDPRQEGASCIECGWSAADYAALAARKPCIELAKQNGTYSAPPTAGPAWLGSLTASLAAATISRLFTESDGTDLAGQEVILEPFSLQSVHGALKHNPQCRGEHARLECHPLTRPASQLTLGQAFALAAKGNGRQPLELGLIGIPWATESQCEACADSPSRTLALLGRQKVSCSNCATDRALLGYSDREHLPRSFFNQAELDMPLSEFGFENGDVLSVIAPGGERRHFELPLDPASQD